MATYSTLLCHLKEASIAPEKIGPENK